MRQRPSPRLRTAAAALVCAAWASACGYRFVGQGDAWPDNVKTAFVPMAVNRTPEAGLEIACTRALRAELLRKDRLGDARSDTRLEAELRSVGGGPTILTANGQLASYRLTGVAYVRLMRGGRVLLEAEVASQEDYLPDWPDGDVLRTETNRAQALQRLVESLMRAAVERLGVGW